MAYKYIISTDAEVADSVAGTTLQLILSVEASDLLEDTAIDAVDEGVQVEEWGKLKFAYDFEDALLAPGTYTVVLRDIEKYLFNLFWGKSSPSTNVDRDTIEAELKRDGTTIFKGMLTEKGKSWRNYRCTLTFDPGIKEVTTKKLYTDEFGVDTQVAIADADEVDGVVTVETQTAHAFTVGCRVNIFDVTGMPELNGNHRIVSIADTTHFAINLETTAPYTSGGSVKQLEALNPLDYTESANYDFKTILLNIYQLIDPTLILTDVELIHDWTFWGIRTNPADNHNGTLSFDEIQQMVDPLFFDSSFGLNTVGDVLKKLAVDWCAFTGMVHTHRPFFKKLFYYNASNLQTLGMVLSREYVDLYSLIDYVEVTTHIGATTRPPYKKGTDPFLEERTLVRDSLPGCYYESLGDYGTNLYGTIDEDGTDDGDYNIVGVKDPIFFGGNPVNNDKLIAEFWYYYRSDPTKCGAVKHVVKGITYDPLKDFNDEGVKYQPIEMEIDFASKTTSFTSLDLGAL